jgi:hypothetical protein
MKKWNLPQKSHEANSRNGKKKGLKKFRIQQKRGFT